MVTTSGKNVSAMENSKPKTLNNPPIPPDPPDPPDEDHTSKLMTTTGTKLDKSLEKNEESNVLKIKKLDKVVNTSCLKTVHIVNLPIHYNYGILYEDIKIFGTIKEIRMNLNDKNEKWEAWVSYESYDNAFKASTGIGKGKLFDENTSSALCEKAPNYLDVYRPDDWVKRADNTNENNTSSMRKPKPPKWLLITTKDEYSNYFKVTRYLQRSFGSIKSGDVSRFGKNTVLVHAKSSTQSIMLCNLNTNNNEIIANVKPHLNFSYGRGVLFDRDLYEFSEDEILDMCPAGIWKVTKIPNTSMIILTFDDEEVPYHINIENERINIKPFKQRPLQCFNCFAYGHPSRVCKNRRICRNCSEHHHEHCPNETKCVNCKENHRPDDRNCKQYKLEEAALNKSKSEHISVGYAKRLLDKNTSYATVARASKNERDNVPPPQPKPRKTAPNPSSSICPPSPSLQAISLELPDLGELPDTHSSEGHKAKYRKRERQPSISPPPSPKIPTSNKFETLDKNIAVEVHPSPQLEKENSNIIKSKPNIMRNAMKNKSQKKKGNLLNNK